MLIKKRSLESLHQSQTASYSQYISPSTMHELSQNLTHQCEVSLVMEFSNDCHRFWFGRLIILLSITLITFSSSRYITVHEISERFCSRVCADAFQLRSHYPIRYNTVQEVILKQQQVRIQQSHHFWSRRLSPRTELHVQTTTGDNSVTSNVISSLAVMALKSRLKSYSDVQCTISSSGRSSISSSDLMKGIFGPVTVTGSGWSSPSGLLTCRAIEASIDVCQLDLGRVLRDRKLVLVKPSIGKAMIGFNENDFANFITHPLMKQALQRHQSAATKPNSEIDASPLSMLAPIQFIKTIEGTNMNRALTPSVCIDPTHGTVTFYALYNQLPWKCVLKRGSKLSERTNDEVRKQMPLSQRKRHNRPAVIEVTRATVSMKSNDNPNGISTATIENMLSDSLSNFFNEMIFDLDGTFLSYRDMMVVPNNNNNNNNMDNDPSSSPMVLLALTIVVKKFPSPGLDF